MSEKLERGLVQIYTGDGKGKTTAAVGLAVRAAGRGFKVYIGQFMKLGEYGEHIALEKMEDDITIEQFGTGSLHTRDEPFEEELKAAKKGLQEIEKNLTSGEYDVIIADEICVAHHFDLLSLDMILELLEVKPDTVELVMTGRKAPEELIGKADLVTEMKEIKHPYQDGIKARIGIEK